MVNFGNILKLNQIQRILIVVSTTVVKSTSVEKFTAA